MTESADMLAYGQGDQPGIFGTTPLPPSFQRINCRFHIGMNWHSANVNANKNAISYATAHTTTTRKRRSYNLFHPLPCRFKVIFPHSGARMSSFGFTSAYSPRPLPIWVSSDDICAGMAISKTNDQYKHLRVRQNYLLGCYWISGI